MLGFITWLFNGPLNRILSSIDNKVDATTEREALKADIIKAHYTTRAAYMKAGGFWLMLMFAAPLGLWFTAVVVYSILWCQGCAYPQAWTIAALPSPLDQWSGAMITAIFGVVGIERLRK